MSLPIPPDALPLSPADLAGVAPHDADRSQVIDDYDSVPTLCVITPRRGVRLLAYNCDRDDGGATYLLVPTTPEILSDLEGNRLPLRDALTVPWMAVVHAPWASWEGDVAWDYVIRPGDVPDDHLPVPGVTLYL